VDGKVKSTYYFSGQQEQVRFTFTPTPLSQLSKGGTSRHC
jgi:hypothetical protein